MSAKKNEPTKSTKPETTKPAEQTSTSPVATVTTTTPGKAPKFFRVLESQVVAFLQAQKLTKMPEDVALFIGWCRNNPPADLVSRPSGESATGKVWAYCDQLVASKAPVSRKAVIEALSAQGLNPATISTQYQRWSKARGAVAA